MDLPQKLRLVVGLPIMLMLQQWRKSQAELETVKNFSDKEIGIVDGQNLDAGIDAVIRNMGDPT
jgi:hypothetical protein